MIKCPLCNTETSDIEGHFRDSHFLSVPEYYEMGESLRSPLTYLTYSDGYYIPDWSKLKRKYEKAQAIKAVQDEIKDFYSKLLGDRYFQLFIIDEIYFSSTVPHCYEEFKNVLKELPKSDRNKIWFLDWNPGYPRIISKENLNGIKVVQIDGIYSVKSDPTEITVNNYCIKLPELIPFDRAHHSRYNILNPSIDCRKTKRLRLKSRESTLNTVKFFSNNEEDPTDCKSIFKVTDRMTGNIIETESISHRDFVVLKLILLRNKNFLRLVFDILEEMAGSVGVLRDSVFLRNTITLNPDNELGVNISWTPKKKRKFINISIL